MKIRLTIFCTNKELLKAISNFISNRYDDITINPLTILVEVNFENELNIFYFEDTNQFEKFRNLIEYKKLSKRKQNYFYIFNTTIKRNIIQRFKLKNSNVLFYPSHRKGEVTEKIVDFLTLNKLKIYNRNLIKKYYSLKNFFSVNFSPPSMEKNKGEKKDLFETSGEFTVLHFTISSLKELYSSLKIKEIFNTLSEIQTDIIDLAFKYHGNVIQIVGNSIYFLFGYPSTNEDAHISNTYKCALDFNTSMENLNKYNPYKLDKPIQYIITAFNEVFYVGKLGSIKYKQFSVIGKNFDEIEKISFQGKDLNLKFNYPIILNENFKDKLLKHKLIKNQNCLFNIKEEKQKNLKLNNKVFALIRNKSALD